MEEFTLTPEQMRVLLGQNRERDSNHEDWESDTDGTSAGSTDASRTSVSSPGGKAKPDKYVPPNKRTTEAQTAFANEAGNPEDKKGKPIGASPGQAGSTYRVQTLPYILTDAQFRYLKKRFPRTLFRCFDDQNHDHAIAHTETMVATRHMQQKYGTNMKILDLYGSPNANEYYNQRQNSGRRPTGRSMESLVYAFTEKDYIRKGTKWGSPTSIGEDGKEKVRYRERKLEDVVSDPDFNDWVAGMDHFQMIHTLYYMDLSLLAALLSPRGGKYKTFSAVIHRHALPEGKLFGGEVTYKKQFGAVRQVNRETRESYTHQDLSWLFDSETKVWRDENHAFTWTFHKVTDETWIVNGSGCPVSMDERFRSYTADAGARAAAFRMNEEALIPRKEWEVKKYTLPGAQAKMVGGKLIMTHQAVENELKVSNFEFIDYLRYQVAGKPRDHEQFASLMAIARREVEVGSRFPGSNSFEVPVDEMFNHVVVAFFVDAPSEIGGYSSLQALGSILRSHRALSGGEAVFNFSDASSSVRTAINSARIVHSIVRSKDTFDGILGAMEKTNIGMK